MVMMQNQRVRTAESLDEGHDDVRTWVEWERERGERELSSLLSLASLLGQLGFLLLVSTVSTDRIVTTRPTCALHPDHSNFYAKFYMSSPPTPPKKCQLDF